MSTYPLPRQAALDAVKAVNDALKDGHPAEGDPHRHIKGAMTIAAERCGLPRKTFITRIGTAERVYGLVPDWSGNGDQAYSETIVPDHPARHHIDIQDGVVLVFSDAHYWPGRISTAHRALLKSCKEFGRELKAVICNGDAFDGASISRFPAQSWIDSEKKPSVKDELDACRDRLTEIELACHRGVEFVWPLGNHDARYEAKLANSVPEFSRVGGFHLKDHFPRWVPAWSCWINGDVVIKHRIRNGVHATHNNVVNAGKTTVTGHLHSLKVTPFSDYNGVRFGVDTGTLADPSGPQFDYCEDNPQNHRSGFVVLTFRDGRLMWPEVVHVMAEGTVEFRGKVYSI